MSVRLTKEMVEALERTYHPLYCALIPSRLLYMATSSVDNKPNITLLSFAKVSGSDEILIPDVVLLKSRTNLEQNPKLSLTCLLYRDFRPYAEGAGERLKASLLSSVLQGLAAYDFSVKSLYKLRFLYALYRKFKRFLPFYPLEVRPRKVVKGWCFVGEAEFLRSGKEFEVVKRLGLMIFGDVFILHSVIRMKVHEIYDAVSWRRIQ